jgi:hypothetical protein
MRWLLEKFIASIVVTDKPSGRVIDKPQIPAGFAAAQIR